MSVAEAHAFIQRHDQDNNGELDIREFVDAMLGPGYGFDEDDDELYELPVCNSKLMSRLDSFNRDAVQLALFPACREAPSLCLGKSTEEMEGRGWRLNKEDLEDDADDIEYEMEDDAENNAKMYTTNVSGCDNENPFIFEHKFKNSSSKFFVSTATQAHSLEFLAQNRIGLIINCFVDTQPTSRYPVPVVDFPILGCYQRMKESDPDGLKVARGVVKIVDEYVSNTKRQTAYAFRVISGRPMLNTAPNVLMHCKNGVHRSGAMSIILLMRYKGMSKDQAESFARQQRSVITLHDPKYKDQEDMLNPIVDAI